MSLTVGDDTLKAFSRQTTIELYQNAVFAALMDRSYEQDLEGAYEVDIQNPNLAGTITSRSRGADWKTAQEVTATQVNLKLDQQYEGVQKIAYEDVRQSPDIGWLDRMRRHTMLTARNYIDANIATYIAGLTYDAANKFTVGSGNTNAMTLRSQDDYSKGTGDELPAKMAQRGALHFFRKNVIDGDEQSGMNPGDLWVICAPEVLFVLMLDMAERGYNWDRLTEDVLSNNRVLTNEAWRGRLSGIDFIVSNQLAVPTSGNDFKCYMGTRKAIALAIDEPVTSFFTPQTNQEGPNYQLNQAGIFGRALVNPLLISEVTLNTTDS